MRPVLACLLLLACDTQGPPPGQTAEGRWALVALNGQPVPAPTPSGDTLRHATLDLSYTVGLGALRWCVGNQGGFQQAYLERVNTTALDASRFRLTWPDWTGATPGVDTTTARGRHPARCAHRDRARPG